MTAVITGLGIAAPNGLGVADYWRATVEGTSRIDRITRFDPDRYPVRLAGEIRDFSPEQHLSGRLLPQTDRITQLALAVSDWALADAGAEPAALHDFDTGIVTACSAGGFEFGQRELAKLWHDGPQHVSAYMSFSWFYAVNTGQISIRHSLRGPAAALVSDQAGGLDAIGQARRQIRAGTKLVIAGGVESTLCPMALISQLPAGNLSTRDDPATAYLPFDVDATGGVIGEGGALLVVEDAAAARARGVRIYGEIAGYAAALDPRPGSARPPAVARTIRQSLADAGIVPSDVDVVFADAAGLPVADRQEAHAIAEVFGPHGIPVTAPKTMIGRLNSGMGALDVATALLAIRDGVVPPTVGTTRIDPNCQIDLVTAARRPARLATALVLARGVGGFNTAVVVRAPSTETGEIDDHAYLPTAS
ncbi:MAG TPA: ketosynthase chain-length factor [Pseudonocardiaceae bacterium]|nr:ketosynthase chain-length factor [Pseudonocardiaceae bacterium]